MTTSRVRRLGRAVAITSAAAAALTALATSPASASLPESHAGTILRDSDGKVDMKASPAPGYDTVGVLTAGTGVKIICQTEGPSMSGPKGTSTIWDMIARGVFVPDAKVGTGSKTYVTDRCNYVAKPSRPNPRNTNQAISWAFERLGSTAWENKCLIFARTAYGWYNGSGWSTAEVGGDWVASHGAMHTAGIPPRGALVWYHNSSGTGHVAISLGEGLIIGTSVNGRVGVAGYKDHGMYRGWSLANFPFAS